ncbi:MAG: uroporphyrinogen-III C-methyltransferase, partial [Halieaceae bacterium]
MTRPSGTAETLGRSLEALGWQVLYQPMLMIEPIAEMPAVPVITRDSIVIFISANAVRAGLPQLSTDIVKTGATVLAVGEATATALAQDGITAVVPARADSEGLLALGELADPKDRPIVIVKGEGGRGLLADTLSDRGAAVTEFVCYRRLPADVDAADFCWHLCREESLVFQASSAETLERLSALLGEGGQPNLLDSPVIVPSARVAEVASALGWSRVLVAENASDRAFLKVLNLTDDDVVRDKPPEEELSTEEERALTEVDDSHKTEQEIESSREPVEGDDMAATGVDQNQQQSAPAPAQPAPRRADWFARLLLVLILLCLGAASYAGWRFLWPQWSQLTGADSRVEERLARLEGREAVTPAQMNATLASGLRELQTSLISSINASGDDLANRQASMAAEYKALLTRLDRMEIRLARLTATDRRQWLAQEAAFTVRLAAQRLSSARDVNAAIALLNNADNLLAEVDDPRLSRARIAIAADRTQLLAAPKVDSVGIHARFSALATQANELTIGSRRVVTTQPIPEPKEEGLLARLGWGWEAALSKLSNYLVIKSRSASQSVFTTPDEEELARQMV